MLECIVHCEHYKLLMMITVLCCCCSHFNEMSKLHDRSSVGDLPLSRSVGMTGPGPVPHSPASTRPLSPGSSHLLSSRCDSPGFDVHSKPETSQRSLTPGMWQIRIRINQSLFFRIQNLSDTENLIVSDSKFLFRSNSTIISLNNSTLIDGEMYCCVFFTFQKTIAMILINYSLLAWL